MTVASKPRPRTSPTWTRRDLVEQVAVGVPGQTPLKIDETAGVIFRVKVLGRFSRNNHGVLEAENGSEYSLDCMRSGLTDYEGKKVKCNHPADRARPSAERPVEDTFGVLRNCVIESDEKGEPAIWADLHCLTSHPMYPRVVEDVKKGLGVYGLSHNAAAKRERFDRGSKRLVIEELATVRSVDLVDKPATNRNLWESESTAVKITLRELLESQRKRFSQNRQSWMDQLLEDDMGMGAEVAPETTADPDAALWSGFTAAIQAILDQFKAGEIDASGAAKKVGEYLKTHAKLSQSDDPEPASESEEDNVPAKKSDETDAEKDKAEKEKQESEAAELARFRAEKKARDLCESLDLKSPTPVQLAAVVGIADDKQRRELIESFKAVPATKLKTPRSAPTGGVKPAEKPAVREIQESQKDEAESLLRIARAD